MTSHLSARIAPLRVTLLFLSLILDIKPIKIVAMYTANTK